MRVVVSVPKKLWVGLLLESRCWRNACIECPYLLREDMIQVAVRQGEVDTGVRCKRRRTGQISVQGVR